MGQVNGEPESPVEDQFDKLQAVWENLAADFDEDSEYDDSEDEDAQDAQLANSLNLSCAISGTPWEKYRDTLSSLPS